MLLTTVWLFFILGTGPLARHQAIDQFPDLEACNLFRTNVQQMLDQGLASGSRVTDCVSRVIVTSN
jgi:hypothetical protein